MSQNTPPAGAGETKPAVLAQAQARPGHEKPRSSRRKMIGRVVSAKMQKTVVVEVVTHRRDPLYGKYVRSRARYKAHDEKGQFKSGDEVEIQEHRPISRDKRWLVTRLVKKYVEE
jgi:small subunit ribosomal protein S17